MENNYLTHHGVKGQKWGVRRYQNPDGSLTAAGKKKYLNDDGALNAKGRKQLGSDGHKSHEHYTRARSKKIADMSDSELRETINRLQMESQYKSLTAKPKSKWVNAAEQALINTGTQLFTSVSIQYATKGIHALIAQGSKSYATSKAKNVAKKAASIVASRRIPVEDLAKM